MSLPRIERKCPKCGGPLTLWTQEEVSPSFSFAGYRCLKCVPVKGRRGTRSKVPLLLLLLAGLVVVAVLLWRYFGR